MIDSIENIVDVIFLLALVALFVIIVTAFAICTYYWIKDWRNDKK